MRQSLQVMQVIDRMITLPFLSPREINRTVRMIQQFLSTTEIESLKSFFEYLIRQWSNTITSEGISIYDLENQTNNTIESFVRINIARSERCDTPDDIARDIGIGVNM